MINKEWKKEMLAKVGDTINCKECIHGGTCNVASAHGGKVAGCWQFQYKPLKNDIFSLEIDPVETHILTELLDEKIGNLATLPPYIDAARYTAQIIAIRKKLDYILLDIRKGGKR